MYREKKICAIIVAAGSGSRMGSAIPKQFLPINGRPMGFCSADIFGTMKEIDQVIFVTQKKYLLESQKALPFAQIIAGGNSRQESVENGLTIVENDVDYIMVHDGARPFVTEKIIYDLLDKTMEIGASICAVAPKDTVRTKEKTLERENLYLVQTPQGFEKNLLMKAYERARAEGYRGTDDASLVEAIGYPVGISDGSYENYKVTTREDLPVEHRVGMGYDVHQLVEGRPLVLGGVRIPFEKGLLGHSDADVLTHTIMDALLGAAAMGDLGTHFPDSGEKYQGISSIELLKIVINLVRKQGYDVENVDVTVAAERPKVSPYIEEMKKALCPIMGIEEEKLNIKGTTTEKLGFVGRKEGIAAYAVCAIKR